LRYMDLESWICICDGDGELIRAQRKGYETGDTVKDADIARGNDSFKTKSRKIVVDHNVKMCRDKTTEDIQMGNMTYRGHDGGQLTSRGLYHSVEYMD
jgi:hypothetical protein